MFDGHWREIVNKGLDPMGVQLRRAGVTADWLTVTGILCAGAAAVVIGLGHLTVGFVLLLCTGIPDALDGAVAKASGTSSLRGAFFDSVSDRLTDALLFGGLAYYLADTREDKMSLLPMAVMGAAMLISYQRAKAESLGFDAKGGLMERAERFIVLAVGLLFSAILVPVLWVMLVLTVITAGQRFAKVWRQASVGVAAPSPARRTRQRRNRAQARTRRATRFGENRPRRPRP
jgi:CDP-diacylglycerol--glycerol-3-phosphate 3-phosphatidyltransferase